MYTHIHPLSGEQIVGLRLASGTRFQGGDKYDSSTGKWEDCPCIIGTVPKGDHVRWVRPNATLSANGKLLLGYLASTKNLLTYVHWWKSIPSPKWRHDGRMDWKVTHPECVQELIDFGFVEPIPASEINYGTSYDSNAIFRIPQENEIYRVSDAGKLLSKSWG